LGGVKVRDWLTIIRKEKKLTMKATACLAGISECYYNQIENGSRNASVKVAKKIADVLGFDWKRFFD
jgi:transcriptional regulator with XRE-family HTH domain